MINNTLSISIIKLYLISTSDNSFLQINSLALLSIYFTLLVILFILYSY